MIERFLALALGIERGGEIGPRLVVERILRDLLFELGNRTDRCRLLGEFERRARGGNRAVIALGFGDECERFLRLLDCAGRYIETRETRERDHIAWVLLQNVPIHFSR